ncbi:hypothetical protein ACFVT5_35015 [Streptomyces sp. NPDC058001]|uniref:hypothetical protein n=1 Tax=Streptomyces sp. NPDC058001 TaxID=3346300 RepID=UPI0036E5B005
MVELFQVLGGIAGLSGVALGVLFLLYRDFVRTIIREKMFRALTPAQATALFGAVIVLAFTIAILGLFVTLADGEGAQRFMVMAGILLAFLLAVLLVAVRVVTGGRRSPTDDGTTVERALTQVARHVARAEPDRAERILEGAGVDREAEEFWYWKARIALARGHVPVALGYTDEALQLDARNPHAVALKIKLLLLGDEVGDRERAAALASASEGFGAELDVWLRRLRAEGMFEPGVRTNTELDDRCPLPARHGLETA